jgi:hypothetical protein
MMTNARNSQQPVKTGAVRAKNEDNVKHETLRAPNL